MPAFHPAKKNLLLSADMDFDVKLWTGKLEIIKMLEEASQKVVWRISFVSRREDLAASCSGDQSLKIWNIDADNEVVASAHAKRTFYEFPFLWRSFQPNCDSFSLVFMRIYKLRTMSLLHTIQLKI
ncbi:hypothetical protein BC829DRAFT_244104 [Chytridium lagenaria]|nr:hypothetical protein BC829DRAFT_244104 [Chytridium lagenaria]